MPEPLVTYPGGSTEETTTVLALRSVGNTTCFVVERTPCHPVNPKWPDQPADRCRAIINGSSLAIDCEEGSLAGNEIRDGVVSDDDDVVGCVIHRVEETSLAVGDSLQLTVDTPYRRLLSVNHSRCHFGAFALNLALSTAWRKDPHRADALGNPDFDQLAITSSTIDERGSIDVYRVGKSLRKKGFTPDTLDDLDALRESIAASLRAWLGDEPSILVQPRESLLNHRRKWQSAINGTLVDMPCGGTHPNSLHRFEVGSVELGWDQEAGVLTMRLLAPEAE